MIHIPFIDIIHVQSEAEDSFQLASAVLKIRKKSRLSLWQIPDNLGQLALYFPRNWLPEWSFSCLGQPDNR